LVTLRGRGIGRGGEEDGGEIGHKIVLLFVFFLMEIYKVICAFGIKYQNSRQYIKKKARPQLYSAGL